MRRQSSTSRPAHRLAHWQRDPVSYRVYMTHPRRRERTSGDYGMDNFSYDPAYLSQWQIPPDLEQHLTPELAGVAYNIILAGSAVRTSVERIEALSNEAVHRLAPRSSHAHLLSRQNSDPFPTVLGVDADVSRSPLIIAPPMLPPIATTRMHKPSLPPQPPINMLGMETPPFTPVDSVLGSTSTPLYNSHPTNSDIATNMDVVSAQLSPLLANQLTLPPNIKNNIAWETFINSVKAEIDDLKRVALSRLRSYSFTFKTLCVEQFHWDGKLSAEAHEGLMGWWEETDGKIEVYQRKAADLEGRIAKAAAALGDEGVGRGGVGGERDGCPGW